MHTKVVVVLNNLNINMQMDRGVTEDWSSQVHHQFFGLVNIKLLLIQLTLVIYIYIYGNKAVHSCLNA